jgi:hypothetical protein
VKRTSCGDRVEMIHGRHKTRFRGACSLRRAPASQFLSRPVPPGLTCLPSCRSSDPEAVTSSRFPSSERLPLRCTFPRGNWKRVSRK